MYSLTISQSCFMWYSERYLLFFAASSHSSGPADFLSRAGPGTGTATLLVMMKKGERKRRWWCWWRGRRKKRCPPGSRAECADRAPGLRSWRVDQWWSRSYRSTCQIFLRAVWVTTQSQVGDDLRRGGGIGQVQVKRVMDVSPVFREDWHSDKGRS